jgi:hypothetical protein
MNEEQGVRSESEEEWERMQMVCKYIDSLMRQQDVKV